MDLQNAQKSQIIFFCIESHNMPSIVMENPRGIKALLGFQIDSHYFEAQMKVEAPLLLLFFIWRDEPCLNYRLDAYSIFQPWHPLYAEG